jgi:uncharacterized metal-binding protein YceD (DUF177 family)
MIAIEFSRSISVDRLGHDERVYEIEANAAERAALAQRFAIISVDRLAARVSLRRVAGKTMVRLNGRFAADVVQSCVVTLEPVPAHLEEDFEMIFSPGPAADANEVVVDLDIEDPPEPIPNGIIDIGEATAEHLALALDPFPRAPGARVEGIEAAGPLPPKPSPFAALAALKKK